MINRDDIEESRARVVEQLTLLKQSGDDTLYQLAISAVLAGADEMSCQEYVERYIKAHKIKVSPAGLYKAGDLIKNPKVLFHRMHQDFKEIKRVNRLKTTLTREEIALEFEAILDDVWTAERNALRTKLAPVENKHKFDDLLTLVAYALVGREVKTEILRQTKAFLAHFAWQVMTKLHKGPKAVLRGGNEAVLMLVSPKQKTGKSSTVRKMVEPFDDAGFLWKARLDRLDDSFSFSNLAYNYVALFDDMCTATSINLGKFKQIITDDEVSFRQIYTSTEIKLPKMATLIGTSNKSPRELMHDTTGLRRFHVIDVANENVYTGKGIDLSIISSIDWSLFYRFCPMTEESPLFSYITPEELALYEENIRPKHVVELWLEDRDYHPEGLREFSVQALYDNFRVWANTAGYGAQYVPTIKSFSQKLVELRFTKDRLQDGIYFYV